MTSLINHDSKPADEKETASPFDREFFFVQCTGFVGMAYRNGDGKWREAFSHRELPNDVWVLE